MDELLEDGTLTVIEAAKFTGLPRTNLYGLMEKGQLPYAQIGRRRLIPRRALVQLLAENLKGPGVAESSTEGTPGR